MGKFKEISNTEGYRKLKDAWVKYANSKGWGNSKEAKRERLYWIIGRARHYSHKTGIPVGDILFTWESDRTYSFPNYYQDSTFPEINSNDIVVVENLEQIKDKVKATASKGGFMCPFCNQLSTDPYKCNSGVIKNHKKCNYAVYGLISIGVNIVDKSTCKIYRIMKPVDWDEYASIG